MCDYIAVSTRAIPPPATGTDRTFEGMLGPAEVIAADAIGPATSSLSTSSHTMHRHFGPQNQQITPSLDITPDPGGHQPQCSYAAGWILAKQDQARAGHACLHALWHPDVHPTAGAALVDAAPEQVATQIVSVASTFARSFLASAGPDEAPTV